MRHEQGGGDEAAAGVNPGAATCHVSPRAVRWGGRSPRGVRRGGQAEVDPGARTVHTAVEDMHKDTGLTHLVGDAGSIVSSVEGLLDETRTHVGGRHGVEL